MLLPLKCSFYNHFTLLPILHKQLKGQKKWAYGVLDIFFGHKPQSIHVS